MDGNVSLRADGALRWYRLGLQRASIVNDGILDCHHGRYVHFFGARNRRVLG